MLIILSWIASLGSITGNIGVIYKKVWGMKVWTFATILWVIYACITKDYAQLLMFIVYTVLNIFGWYTWSKKSKNKRSGQQ